VRPPFPRRGRDESWREADEMREEVAVGGAKRQCDDAPSENPPIMIRLASTDTRENVSASALLM
jgi:hypothetical protein